MMTRTARAWVARALAAGLLATAAAQVDAQCPASTPVQGGALPAPLPLFPADNWWNQDVSAAPVDPASASYIAFINNGGTRRMHPDFGGEESSGSVNIYGMPYAVVSGSQPKLPVTFDYADESDGVDASGKGVPYYPIPAQAITQSHWIEGGAPGNVDQRDEDRHLLIIDCTSERLYELYSVYYDVAQGRWFAGSGASFDLNSNTRRPEGWTSADAAGLAIFPGLVRYDEAWDPAVAEIKHALRVTVRATKGHVYPASHTAGSTTGALPLGARLRLKANVNGADPALRTSNPNVQKIFRAMQKYGLIVADNGSDLYVSGTFDKRWDNDILNPAFSLLTASDFEVVQLGWKGSTTQPPTPTRTLASITVTPSALTGGQSATGRVTLTTAAPAGGAAVTLSSASSALTVPATVTVPQGATSADFTVRTTAVTTAVSATLTAAHGGVSKSVIVTVSAAPATVAQLAALSLSPASLRGGASSTGTVTLTRGAPAGGALVTLASSSRTATVPASVTVPEGATSRTFTVTTRRPWRTTTVTISAGRSGVTKTAALTVRP